MSDDQIDFPDYEPSGPPDCFPRTIWANWDSWGEFMCSTQDPVEGDRLMKLADRGCGYTVAYEAVRVAGADYVAGKAGV